MTMKRMLIGPCMWLLLACAPAAFSETLAQELPDYMQMLAHTIALPSVQGTSQGNDEVRKVAEYLATRLESAGFPESDVRIIAVDDTGGHSYVLVASYPGTDSSLRPVYFNGHMDVVDAGDPKGWTDGEPYKMVKQGRYYYGRGVADMKNGTVGLVATFMRLKQEGYKPKRGMMLLLSGDEETTFNGARYLAKHYHDGEVLIDADGAGGSYNDTSEPTMFSVGVSEKTNMDFLVRATSPGGHSSEPTPQNAIYYVADALQRISAYEFPVQHTDVTLGSLAARGKRLGGKLGGAMVAFARNPDDQQAISVIEAAPAVNGQIHTTCVATIISGGVPFARNALPEMAEANVNCRTWPGVTAMAVQATLTKLIDDPHVTVSIRKTTTQTSPESSMLPSVWRDMASTIHERFPNVEVVQSMSSGASDAQFWRKAAMPAYGFAPEFAPPGGSHAHGYDERTLASEMEPSLAAWYAFMVRVTKS